MMKFMVGSSAVLMLVAAATQALAQVQTEPLSEGRPCAYGDLVGLWASRVERSDEPGIEDMAAFAPNDYLRFRADGGMMYMASTRANDDASEVHARLDELDRLDGFTFRADIPSAGMLILWKNGEPFQGFTCTVAEPLGGKSIVLLTQLKGQPALRRVSVRMD